MRGAKEMGISMKFVRHNTHSRRRKKKDQLEEIYAGDKFKTHVLPERRRERRRCKKGRGREMAYVEAINCLFIVCYLFAFLFIASRFVSSPTARDHTNVRPVTVTVTT